MNKATVMTALTTPWRGVLLIGYAIAVVFYECRHFLKWQAVGFCIALCAIQFLWLVNRQIDLSLLNPASYNGVEWALFVIWHLLWVWAWVNE